MRQADTRKSILDLNMRLYGQLRSVFDGQHLMYNYYFEKFIKEMLNHKTAFGRDSLFPLHSIGSLDSILKRQKFIKIVDVNGEVFEAYKQKHYDISFQRRFYLADSRVQAANILNIVNAALELLITEKGFIKKYESTLSLITDSKKDHYDIGLGVGEVEQIQSELIEQLQAITQPIKLTPYQTLVVSAMIEINAAYITALQKHYCFIKPKYPIFDLGWVEWYRLRDRIEALPTTEYKGEFYYDAKSVKRCLNEYLEQDIAQDLIPKHLEAAENLYDVISRIQYLHNMPFEIESKQHYLQLLKIDHDFADDLFMIYCMFDHEYMGMLSERKFKTYPHTNDVKCIQYIIKMRPQLTAILEQMADMLNWQNKRMLFIKEEKARTVAQNQQHTLNGIYNFIED